jgi:putative transcriptional regulator
MDWRAFRAQLVAATATTDEANSSADSSATPAPPRPTSADGDALWAHRIAEPERGCLLVAHPLMFSNAQTYFSQVRERVERREVG